jgi:hypothetical protein
VKQRLARNSLGPAASPGDLTLLSEFLRSWPTHAEWIVQLSILAAYIRETKTAAQCAAVS